MSPTRSRKQHQKKFQEIGHERRQRNFKRFPIYVFLVAGIVSFLLICSGAFLLSRSDETEDVKKVERNYSGRTGHEAMALPVKELEVLMKSVNITKLWNKLEPMLIPRRPGTKNIKLVRNHISETLKDLKGWHIELDTFYDTTPRGRVEFSNIIASTNPNANRKLVLACHHDSKDMRDKKFEFIGATDSAVPCAIMLEIARALNDLLKEHTTKVYVVQPIEPSDQCPRFYIKRRPPFIPQRLLGTIWSFAVKQMPQLAKLQQVGDSSSLDVSLDLIFFDGEEAYAEWTATDSIYGARHLAKKWSNDKENNVLNDIDLLVLLDLIGHEQTAFVNFQAHPSVWWDHARSLEKRLKKGKLLSHKRDVFYHHGKYERHTVEDDHVPFQKKGVPVLHLISIPFPRVWHTRFDNVDALDSIRIEVVTKILTAFVAEYLHLRLPPK